MESVQDLSIPGDGRRGEIVLPQPRLALLEILIEYLTACAPRGTIDDLMQVAEIWKVLHERKCA